MGTAERYTLQTVLDMTGYELSRRWFDFCFDNPEKIKPNHTALYFFCVEWCNRMGWKEKIGLPTSVAKEAIGIHSYNTYINTLNDLIDFGFIKLIQKSKNQYSSNIIALSNFDKAKDEAKEVALSNFDKALINHVIKQSESTVQSTGESTSSIYKPLTINKETIYSDADQKEYNGFNEWVDSEIPNLRKKGKQINIEQYFKLKTIEGFSGDELKDYTRRLSEWRSSNKTVYNTIINWRNKDLKNAR